MRRILRQVLYFLNRRRAERDLAEEMAAHRAELDPAGAARFGNSLRLREESRDVWGFLWLDQLAHDLRYGMRSLRQAPGFTFTAVLILTLGLGLNLAFFQILNATVLQPLPVMDPDTLVRFHYRAEFKGGSMSGSNLPLQAAEFLRDHNSVLSAMFFEQPAELAWGDNASDRLNISFVSTNWFAELGYSATLGRAFNPEIDDAPGAPPVAVVSHRFWQDRLGADSGAIGSTVRIENRAVTLIGIVPASFPGLRMDTTDVWIPLRHGDYFISPVRNVNVYGRVRPGLSPAAVLDGTRAPVEAAIQEGLMPNPFTGNGGSGVRAWLEPYYGTVRFELPRDVRERWIMAGIIGGLTFLVLLVACANLSNLLLSRMIGRTREFGVRSSLGATRWRVLRQLMTECALLALFGALGGLAAGSVVATAVARLAELPAFLDFTPDARTVAAAAGFVVFTMLAIGLLPAWKISRQNLAALTKDGGQTVSSGLDRARLRQILLTAQMAGSCLLLVLAGLALQSLRQLLEQGPGFDYGKIAVLRAPLERYGLRGAESAKFWSAVKRDAALWAEAEGVALVSTAPLAGPVGTSRYKDVPLRIVNERVDPGFFQAMRIPIIAGRDFTPEDAPDQVVILSRTLAVEMFGSPGNSLGKQAPSRATVIGVAGDARLADLQAPAWAEMYGPIRPGDIANASLLVRARTDPRLLLERMRQSARTADSRVLAEARLMEADFFRKVQTPRLARTVSAFMALLSLTLACLGVFGVVSYSAALRTKEIGIRMALGSPRNSIVRILLRQLGWPTVIGVLAGGAGAAALAQVLAGEPLYLTGFSPGVLAASIALLTITAAAAALLPAFRALRRDPLEALRYE